jgi:hypothetical protein
MEVGKNWGIDYASYSSLYLKSLPYDKEILNFQQKDKETIGAVWDHFSILSRSGLDLSIPNHVLL